MMIAEHDSIEIQYIELFLGVCNVPNLSRNVVGESSQMDFGNEIDMPEGHFVAMLASGTSSSFHPVEPSTYGSSYGEKLDDSSEDENIEEPDLFPDDGDDAPSFGVAEFVLTGGNITFYEPHAHIDSVDFDAIRAPQFPDMP
ncbi:hypothetical protein GQ457_16G015520 [Hibiscus cannabinus]